MFCHHCDDSLAGHRYVLRDDHPYCIKCYENVFANNCDECGKIIGIDSKDLSYKEKHWHEACFLCNKCRTSLVDKQFGSKVSRGGNIRWKYFRWLKIFSRLLKIFRCFRPIVFTVAPATTRSSRHGATGVAMCSR